MSRQFGQTAETVAAQFTGASPAWEDQTCPSLRKFPSSTESSASGSGFLWNRAVIWISLPRVTKEFGATGLIVGLLYLT